MRTPNATGSLQLCINVSMVGREQNLFTPLKRKKTGERFMQQSSTAEFWGQTVTGRCFYHRYYGFFKEQRLFQTSTDLRTSFW